MEAPAKKVFACQGTVLHFRLAGLTQMVSVFEHGLSAGARELEQLLARYFGQITDWIERFGGDALELSPFAILAFFPDTAELKTSVARSLACALAVREDLKHPPEVPEYAENIKLSIRMGVGSGAIHGLLLGDEDSAQRVAFTGAALQDARRASHQAAEEQIVLYPSSGVRIDPEQVSTDPPLPTPALARLEALLIPPEPVRTIAHPSTPASDITLRPFLAPVLRSILGRQQSLSDFRKLCSLSLVVEGIDPASSGSLEPLVEWFSFVQNVVHSFGGHILEIDVGQPTRMHVIFGAPLEHPDDEARTLQCALALQRTARDLSSVSEQRLGVSSGAGFVGLVGGQIRHEYCAIGERLQLAAQLATFAGPWETLVDRHTVSRAGFGFDWGPPPPIPPGSGVELQTARVLYGEGAYGAKLTSRSRGNVLGRESIMTQLRSLADNATEGQGGLVCLSGEPGIGKTSLLMWLGQYLQHKRRWPVYVGECNALVRHAPYHAWINVFRDWMDLEPDLPAVDSVARVTERVGSLDPDLLTRLPLLGMVTGLSIPDNATTEGLDAQKRRGALHALVLEMLSLAHRRNPVAIIIEDAHWMDQASADLLRYLVRNVGFLPIFMTMTRRPREPGQADGLDALQRLPNSTVIPVGTLSSEALISLACRHVGAQEMSEELAEELLQRSLGVPLYLEELTLYLRDAEMIQVDRDGVARLRPQPGVTIPNTPQEVILARVARLDEGARMTLKAASVIGRSFTLSLLQEIYPVPFDTAVLIARLERVEGLDIVRRDLDPRRGNDVQANAASVEGELRPGATFYFKHSLIRDTIYDTLTAASRRSLHEAIGLALERRMTPENRDETVLLLAEHFRRTMCVDKQRIYYRLAGEVARSRALNREAYDYFRSAEELCHLASDRESVVTLLEAQVGVLNFLGERDLQREAIARWQEVARELNDHGRFADALRAEGALLARSGEPLKGLKTLERARRISRTQKDVLREARILRVISRIHFQKMDLPRALETAQKAFSLTAGSAGWQEVVSDEANVGTILTRMNQKEEGRRKLEDALRLTQEQGDVRLAGIILSNLGVLDLQEGRYDCALRLWERALVLKRQVGERQEEVLTQANISLVWLLLGGYPQALDFGLEALALARQIEERWAEANICQCLGLIHAGLDRSDEARAFYNEAIEIAQSCDARYVEIEALEGLARLNLKLGQTEEAETNVRAGLERGNHRRVHFLALLAWLLSGRNELEEALEAVSNAQNEMGVNADQDEPLVLVKYYLAMTCRRAGRDEAEKWMDDARTELLERAGRIEDRALREQMLQAVPENRRVLETWEAWRQALTIASEAEAQ